MIQFKFGSLKREGTGYLFDSSYYSIRGSEVFYHDPPKYVDSHFYEYLTYTDGLTQHSPEHPVVRENFEDLLNSLALHLHKNPEDLKTFCDSIVWPLPLDPKEVNFLAALKYIEEKPTYYNRSELKISRSPSKQFDKRWELIEPWVNGNTPDIVRLLYRSFMGFSKD